MNNRETTEEITSWTDRPGPFLPGLYSVQATSEDPMGADVIAYRLDPRSAEAVKNSMMMRGGFDWFLLRHSEELWDVYDCNAVFESRVSSVTDQHVREVLAPVEVDREKFLEEARAATDTPRLVLVAVAEGHAGASAADHSNFVLMCRRMVTDAGESDVEKMFVVESRTWGCRAVGLFAVMDDLSPEMQDVFLERWSWLSKGWPLLARHHQDILADRLAKTRSDYVQQLLVDCGHAAGLDEQVILGMRAKWSLASPGAKYRFAQHIVATLDDGILLHQGQAETFAPDVVEALGEQVVKDYRSILR